MNVLVSRIATSLQPLRGRAPHERVGRTMAVAILVNGLGSGLFLPLSALYFTTVVGFTPGEVAAGLGMASLAGVLSGVVFGTLADRLGPKPILVTLLLATAAVIPVYLAVSAWWQYTLVATAIRVLDRGVSGVAAALVAHVVPGAAARTEIRAVLRTALALGVSGGAALSALVLSSDSSTAYTVAILVDAATFAFAGLVYLRLPSPPRTPSSGRSTAGAVWKDAPFLGITAVFSLLSIYSAAVTFALPIWAVRYTTLPHPVISAAFVTSAVAHLLLQVPLARMVKSREAAIRAAVAGGAVLAGASLLFAATAAGPTALASVLLIAAVVLNAVGGLCTASAQFYISSDVAPESAQGQYQGLISTGMALSAMIAPALMATLPLGLGWPGWFSLAVMFLGAATMLPLLVRAALRGRTARQADSLEGSLKHG